MPVSEPLTLPDQLRNMRQSVDPDTGAILFRHPTLQGIPDLVVEADGYTMEFNCFSSRRLRLRRSQGLRPHPALPRHR